MGSRSRNALMAFPRPTVCQGQCLICLTGQAQGQKRNPAITWQPKPALPAAGTTPRAAPAACSKREGCFCSYRTGVQWGFKTIRKSPGIFSCLLDRRIPPCLKVVCWPLPQRSMQSEATTGHGDSPYYTILSDQ